MRTDRRGCEGRPATAARRSTKKDQQVKDTTRDTLMVPETRGDKLRPVLSLRDHLNRRARRAALLEAMTAPDQEAEARLWGDDRRQA